MDVLSTVTVHGAAFPLHNPTEYYIDRWLDSTYGFELYYRPRRGIQQLHWLDALTAQGFDKPLVYRRGIHYTETRSDTLDFWPLIARPFALYWVSGDQWYGLGFDGREFLMQDNNDTRWLPSIIL